MLRQHDYFYYYLYTLEAPATAAVVFFFLFSPDFAVTVLVNVSPPNNHVGAEWAWLNQIALIAVMADE